MIIIIITVQVVGKPELSIERPKSESMTVYESTVLFKGKAKTLQNSPSMD